MTTPTFAINKPKIVDIECMTGLSIVAFRDVETGAVIVCEHGDNATISRIMSSYTTISFNGNKYDLPMIAAALQGYSQPALKELSNEIITSGKPHWEICRERGIEVPWEWDHVDLIEVAPGKMTSLKLYGGRMHSQRLQDLPYPHDKPLTEEEKQVVRDYCGNDLITTEDLLNKLRPQLDLRIAMSQQYEVDLRSKSDAQIAEAVLKREALRTTATAVRKVPVPADTKLRYRDPGFLTFQTPELQALFPKILATEFVLGEGGSPVMPEWLKRYAATIGSAKYKLGIGGLHSQETCQLVVSGEGYVIADFDVASFYPNIILQQGMVPPGVGESFLQVYQSIVDRRIAAKRSGDKVVADSLKITLNGTFGKLGSHYSFLYAPEMLIQVTITGQLALLMLIERLHLAGIECKSANTDGIVLKFKESDLYWLYEVLVWWQKATGYELERTNYRLVASRDVNNYLAITDKGKIKGKGIFTPADLMKNPDREIVYEAVSEHIKSGTDIGKHIRGCTDIRKFLTVRTVKGGAAWYDQYLGKAIRFYHSTMVAKQAFIKYADSGNKVANSEGCRPMMEMFPSLPSDIDYDYYIGCANALLQEVGYN